MTRQQKLALLLAVLVVGSTVILSGIGGLLGL